MKELSIEEKAKSYDEAIERAKVFKEHLLEINDKDYADEMDYIFPELKESEDERIRKDIIVLIKDWWDRVNKDNISTKEQMLAWLKKQGEHKKFINGIQVGDKVTRNEDGVLVNLSQLNRVAKKQGEQKPAELTNSQFVEKCKSLSDLEKYILSLVPTRPIDAIKVDARTIRHLVEQEQKSAWSEEDEQIILSIEQVMNCASLLNIVPEKIDKIKSWLKSIKDRLQPKQEWGEEDIRNINDIDSVLFYDKYLPENTCMRLRNWLESLKQRIGWKPTKEQIRALHDMNLTGNISYAGQGQVLIELYNDLLKLKA